MVCVTEKTLQTESAAETGGGSCGELAAASQPKYPGCKVLATTAATLSFGGPAARVVSLPKERFLYFSGRQDAPSSDRFHCRLTSAPVLTLSVRNPILVQPGGRDGERRRRWVSNSAELCRSSGLHRAPCERPYSPGAQRRRWSLTSRSIPTLRLDCTGSLRF